MHLDHPGILQSAAVVLQQRDKHFARPANFSVHNARRANPVVSMYVNYGKSSRALSPKIGEQECVHAERAQVMRNLQRQSVYPRTKVKLARRSRHRLSKRHMIFTETGKSFTHLDRAAK